MQAPKANSPSILPPISIEILPQELLILLFTFLPFNDLRSARLACKNWLSLVNHRCKQSLIEAKKNKIICLSLEKINTNLSTIYFNKPFNKEFSNFYFGYYELVKMIKREKDPAFNKEKELFFSITRLAQQNNISIPEALTVISEENTGNIVEKLGGYVKPTLVTLWALGMLYVLLSIFLPLPLLGLHDSSQRAKLLLGATALVIFITLGNKIAQPTIQYFQQNRARNTYQTVIRHLSFWSPQPDRDEEQGEETLLPNDNSSNSLRLRHVPEAVNNQNNG